MNTALTCHEAASLLNHTITSHTDVEQAARVLLARGGQSILIQCERGHECSFSHDYWTDGNQSFWLSNPTSKRLKPILASDINAYVTQKHSLPDAVILAHLKAQSAMRLDKMIYSEQECMMPYLSPTPIHTEPVAFKPYHHIGLYPIVDSTDWLCRLLPLGVKTIQLRIKDHHNHLESEIKTSVALAQKQGATLFINDYWELAIKYGANGVHLGQSDLDNADIAAIHRAGLLLGISTHCYYEVARAHAIRPSYMACGPIYATTSKAMPFPPQGIEALQHWRRILHYPLVAIGGINHQRLKPVLETGVNGVALISAITEAKDPVVATQSLLSSFAC